jgi:hypothetical protein
MNTMEIVLTSVLTSIGGAALVLGGLSAWLGSVWKGRIERQENALIQRIELHEKTIVQIDVDLRAKRIPVYEKLWALMRVLPKWPRDDTMTYERLRQFSEALRDWYFGTGGMYLSQSSREAFVTLQDQIRSVLQSDHKGIMLSNATDDYETVRKRCSELRTRLSVDIASRREAMGSF